MPTLLSLLALASVPDPALTPGAVDHSVAQWNVATTICVAGYAAKARHVTAATKRKVVAAYRRAHPDWPPGPYEIDHLISIEVGGSNEATNLWPEPLAEARKKDVVESRAHRAVCSGKKALEEAQKELVQWKP